MRQASSQNSKRAAVRKALDRHKVYITAQSFSGEAYRARVLVDGEAYWVDEFRLSQLQSFAGRAGIDASHRRLREFPLATGLLSHCYSVH
jgi:hypothetical protein